MSKSIKNGGYAFLTRLDLMFSVSLWKEFQLLQILNDITNKYLIKLILNWSYIIHLLTTLNMRKPKVYC